MITLLAIRHAKSDWAAPFEKDFDRPLNERGKTDAPKMAKRIADKNCIPDLIISSTANRALSTARLMAKEWNSHSMKFIEEPELYHASPNTILKCLKRHIPKDAKCVAFYCHNPGITEFVNEFSNLQIDNVPTCGVCAMQWDSWNDVGKQKGELLFFDYPKNIFS
ncbi:MAG: histidine phosphatase family protein [Flavobacteriales bacterium]|nr:histidine phosphatase family protein [Flavobacteriales bacterium]